MLSLKNIHKHYGNSGNEVPALNGISIDFRQQEFVSILGPSGCGKTTLLNIIGSLDQYSEGDLVINGKSTKQYKDSDWDAYRNTTIGFVFQDYNLIPHLNVLGNVELALTLSGVNQKERREKAIDALTKVGLKDHIKKRPNQLSGGQKQRVAIARAIVNDPSIILADEPTGALDTKTSMQIMDILKSLSKDRLVIMVTHNNELAEQYSTRIIRLLDGKIVDDSNPFNAKEEVQQPSSKKEKTSMSFFTAFKLSLQNLWTKKTRTILTAFAGSIGIIGIALVLAMSTGFSTYINTMQQDTLSSMPIVISRTAFKTDLATISSDMMGQMTQGDQETDSNDITTYDPTETSIYHKNTITTEYLEYLDAMNNEWYTQIVKNYGMSINILAQSGTEYSLLSQTNSTAPTLLTSNRTQLESSLTLLAGKYPTEYSEVLLIVDSRNQISEDLLQKLGLLDSSKTKYSPEDFLGKEFKAVTNDEFYQYNADTGLYSTKTINADMYNNASITLSIVGVVQNNTSMMALENVDEGIGYTHMLCEHIHNINMQSQIVTAQIEKGISQNVLTGMPFSSRIINSLVFTAEDNLLSALQTLGGTNIPSSIYIYSVDFESKDYIQAYLNEYNANQDNEANYILSTDYSEMITGTFNAIVDAISIVLIIFAGISLVVSSIMIGIITYVSVIERTKEIGVLRSLGARKKDIARVFNAETMLIGLTAGIFGILVTLLLTIPINLLISSLAAGISISASLNPLHALILIVLSTALTLIAGLIPARIASKKDPVLALRNE